MKTLAAVLVKQRHPLELHEVEVPRLEAGQVLVRVLCSGICGSQLGEIAGVKGEDPYLPHLLGHEGCGEVEDTGPQVRKVGPGQRVVLHWRKGSGMDAPGARYFAPSLGTVNSGAVTTFSRYTVVSENRVTPVPRQTEPSVAALMGCAVTTGMGVVTRDAALRIGESLLVLGAGGVGLSVLQAARLAGAYPIVAVDRFAARLELAASLGADFTHVSTDQLERQLQQQFGAFDVVIESTGNVAMIEMAYRLTEARGRCILVGVPPVGEQASIATLPLHFGKVLRGSHGGDTDPDTDIPRYLRLHQAGRLPLHGLISASYELSRVNTALDVLRNGSVAGRVLLTME